jgi:alpha-glucosidase
MRQGRACPRAWRFLPLLALGAPGFSGCSPAPPAPPVTLGDFILQVGGGHLRVFSAENPARKLLESAMATTGVYSPAAVRHAQATIENRFGYFRFTEDNAPWQESRRISVKRQSPTELAALWRDASGAPVASVLATAPAPRVLRLQVKAEVPGANRLSLAFACAPEDHFLGFGAQADGIDHRGQKVPIWTSEPGIGKTDQDDPDQFWFVVGTRHASSMGLPTFLSSRGYVAAAETNRRSVFELCSVHRDAWRLEVWDRELVFWIYDGPSPKEALERATAGVLGRPRRPPPLAFAPWNDAIFGPESVRGVAALLRSERIPSSVLWTEDFRGGEEYALGYRLKEEWAVDRSLYPDPEGLAAELGRQGFAWFAYFNTFLVQGTQVFSEALAGGHFVKSPDGGPYLFEGATFLPTGLADLSRPETREWVKGYLRRALDVGFTGWMADFGEWLPHDAVLASGQDPMEAHNLYPLEWAKLNDEVLAERATDGVQRLFFARSGWFGSNSVVPVFWAGDQRTSFQRDDGLFTVIPMGINLGLAGVSTYGHDIAGYQSATNPPASKELFFRWTTLGALSPVMRTHHGTRPRQNWWFGQDAETLAHFKRWATLHLRLFPYLDGGSRVAETTGIPLMRALALEFPEDPAAWTVADQYLLGPALLVAPVADEGATSRVVHLPPGRWLAFHEGMPQSGPADLEVPAARTEIPLFGRAGGIVPLLPEGVDTVLPADPPLVDLAAANDRRTLLVFAGADGSFTERDGTTYTLRGAPSDDALVLREGTMALGICASPSQRGCVAERDDARRRALVRLSGQGPLDLGGAKLTVSGGSSRTLDVLLRW